LAHRLTWLSALVATLVLFAGAWALIASDHSARLQTAKEQTRHQLEVISYLVRSTLDQGDEQNITELISQWAMADGEVAGVIVHTLEGATLGEFRSQTPAAHTLTETRSIGFRGRERAIVSLTRSLEHVYEHSRQLAFRLLEIAALLSLGAVVAVYLLVKRQTEAQRLRERSQELQEANERLETALADLDLSESDKRRLAAFPRDNPNPILAYDGEGRVTFENPAFTRLREALGGKTPEDVLPPAHRQLLESSQRGQPAASREYACGSRYLIADYQLIPGADATYVYFRDITEQRLAETELIREQSRAKVTLASIGDAVVTTDSYGLIEYLNPVAEQLCGIRSAAAVGKPLAEVVSLFDLDAGEALGDVVERCTSRRRPLRLEGSLELASLDGRRYPIDASVSPIRIADHAILGVVLVMRDVTAERRLQNELTRQATHDALTGLLNRSAFETHLEAALDSARSRDQVHALCYLDLDQFKVVNDTCGHVAGDELLRQLTGLMRREFRAGDAIARLGGDEFAVLIHDCAPELVVERAERFRLELSDYSFAWQDKSFRVGVSIGITMIDRSSEGIGELLSRADAACYVAKDQGRNCVHLFNPDDLLTAERHGEMQWVARINGALDEDRFVLFGQRIVSVGAQAAETYGIELLLRMVDEQGQRVSPGAFLPAAERYDLMGRLDRWVIRNAFETIARHEALESVRTAPLNYFINLSGNSLSQGLLLDFVRSELHASGVNPSQITFEVTETAAIRNLSLAARLIADLRQLGCRFALDDFGSGLSSFGYLKSLPVDFLKIDGAFIREIERDSLDRTFVAAIQAVAAQMNLRTIAEFVEAPSVLEVLDEIGIDLAQGYGIATPEPLHDLLAQGRPKPPATSLGKA
jgi:diguanylate cyclase (GGDEF)-like protein/PAS domain S-box-containing protein